MSPRKKRAALFLLGRQSRLSQNDTRYLLGKNKDWIMTEPLDDVSMSLLALYLHDTTLLDAEAMALIARRLVTSEQQVGGPYGKDTKEDKEANAAIAQLFILLGAPLPNVNEYIHRIKETVVSPLFTLLLEYPKNITKSQSPQKSTRSTKSTPSVEHIEKELAALHNPARKTALALWQEMKQTYSYHEIISFSKDFGASLTPSFSAPIHLYDMLSRANVYFWLASIIYDDFIDDETTISQLPVANITYRKSLLLYNDVLSGKAAHFFTMIDEANAWELAHCRFLVTDTSITVGALPHYKDHIVLAHRAIGHILGPLAIAQSLGVSKASEAHLYKGLCHYLIARQLDDDLHDWEDDTKRGHISPIVAMLLDGAGFAPGEYPVKTVVERLRVHFFQDGLQKGCDLVLHHMAKARELLLKTELIMPNSIFFSYADTVEHTAKKAVGQVKQHQIFLKKYSQTK